VLLVKLPLKRWQAQRQEQAQALLMLKLQLLWPHQPVTHWLLQAWVLVVV
jgi:hypothetical protein